MRPFSLPRQAGQGPRSCRWPATPHSAAISGSCRRRSKRGADGRAAAARGPAPVHCRRRLAHRPRTHCAGDPRPRPRKRACCCSAISATRGCARRSTPTRTGSASSTSSRPTSWSTSTRHPPMPGLKPHGLEQWLEEMKLFTEWYCPAVGADVDTRRLPRRLARSARAGCQRRARAGHGAARLSCREHHAGRRPRVASRISACSISRTRLPAIRPTISLPCSKMLGATCRPTIERAMIDRYVDCNRVTALPSSAPIGCSRRSATRGSSASSPGCGSATASRSYRRFPAAHVGPARARPRPSALAPVRDWFDANIPPEHRAAAMGGSRVSTARRRLRSAPKSPPKCRARR